MTIASSFIYSDWLSLVVTNNIYQCVFDSHTGGKKNVATDFQKKDFTRVKLIYWLGNVIHEYKLISSFRR